MRKTPKILIMILLGMVCTIGTRHPGASVHANTLHIIPENAGGKEKAKEYVKDVANPEKGGTALERYEEKVKEIEKSGDVGIAFSTGIM